MTNVQALTSRWYMGQKIYLGHLNWAWMSAALSPQQLYLNQGILRTRDHPAAWNEWVG